MRLRGLTGARDEFHLAAIVQNLKTLANDAWHPPPDKEKLRVPRKSNIQRYPSKLTSRSHSCLSAAQR